MSNYTAPKYEPTLEVMVTHSIIHVDPIGGFTVVDNTFDPFNMNYLYSVVTVPAIILGVGIIAILLLFIISNCFAPGTCFWKYCWYYICCCFCCPPKDKDMDIKKLEQKKQEWLARSNRAAKACYGVILAIVVGALFLWMGNADLTQGMNDAKDLIPGLIDITDGPSNSLISNTNELKNSIYNSDCTWIYDLCVQCVTPACAIDCAAMNTTLTNVGEYGDAILSLGIDINNIADPIHTGLTAMNTGIADAIPIKDMYVLYVFIGLIVLCFLNFLTVWRKSPYISCVVSILNYVLMIVLLIICSISMILVMVLSDFCVDPAAGLMTVAGNASETIQHYTTCIGSSKFQSSINSIEAEIVDFTKYIGSANATGEPSSVYNLEANLASYNQTFCANYESCHQCSNALYEPYTRIGLNAESITDDLSCESINKIYDPLINTALCKSSFSGIYKVWGDLYFIALFLFVLLCCISKLYQYMISDDDVEARKPWFKPHYKLVAAEVEMTDQNDNRPSVVNIL